MHRIYNHDALIFPQRKRLAMFRTFNHKGKFAYLCETAEERALWDCGLCQRLASLGGCPFVTTVIDHPRVVSACCSSVIDSYTLLLMKSLQMHATYIEYHTKEGRKDMSVGDQT